MKVDKKEFVAPVSVLVLICFFTALLLALTYKIANPIILANNEAAAVAARKELLPDADNFTDATESLGELATSEDGKAKVTEVYSADNGAGIVYTVETTSFGGKMTMMVGVDGSGAVTGVKIQEHADTAGVGTKNFTDEYLAQYAGLSTVGNEDVKKDGSIVFISGASVTGTAVHKGVSAALNEYAKMGGVQ